MTGPLEGGTRIPLGDLTPAASRHNWRRSAVTVHDGTAFVGTSDGRVIAADLDEDTVDERWSVGGSEEGSVVSIDAADGLVVAGERGPTGRIRVLSADTGETRWTYVTAEDVGSPARESVFAQPYVLDARVADGPIVVAARRSERDGDGRSWSSVVYGFDRDGSLRWGHDARASPVAVDVDDDRVAVGYNRCPHDHDAGLVVLDRETGAELATWDPEAPGERRVGDVALAGDAIAVASHADKRGYLLDEDGRSRWRVDLGCERDVGGETLYAYPTHVAVVGDVAAFVTGNSFAAETRDPEGWHPNEHAATGVELAGGEVAWSHDVRGFARGVSTSGDRVAVPSAQHFRERAAESHAIHLLDAGRGPLETRGTEGIPTAVSLADGRLVAIEEPVEYHDEGVTRGAYRFHAWRHESTR